MVDEGRHFRRPEKADVPAGEPADARLAPVLPQAFGLLGRRNLVVAARKDEAILERRVRRDRQRRNELEELAGVHTEHPVVFGFLTLVDRRMVHEQIRDVADGNPGNHRVDVVETGEQRRDVRAHRQTVETNLRRALRARPLNQAARVPDGLGHAVKRVEKIKRQKRGDRQRGRLSRAVQRQARASRG